MVKFSRQCFRRSLAEPRLLATVHLEALWREPLAYLTAAKWWVLRKRVRARGQFAPLLGRTSRAYEWWMFKQVAQKSASPRADPPIIALVATTGDADALRVTLASLALENVTAFVVDSEVSNDLGKAAAAIDWTQSPWLLPMVAGDRLASGAARAYREALPTCGSQIIFADDDVLDGRGRHTAPHFKPDWNSELFRHYDYLTGTCLLRADREALEAAAGEEDWAKALAAGAIEAGGGAAHLQQVLHHRQARDVPRLPPDPLATAANLPCVSVIIPTRNRVDLLRTCITGLRAAQYPQLEIIVVDNDSDDRETLEFLDTLSAEGVRVLRHAGAFNYSSINNRAVDESKGELICLLNNDIEMISPNWLAIMVTQALREEVGAVGAQLLYPDGRIQHAGVVIGVGNAAGHAHRFLNPREEGYLHRHSLPQFVSAVTAACLVVRRDRFLAVGGLDEKNFAVAFNDVDLCLRLNQRGWQSFYEPRAVLIHHESVSRGLDVDPVGAARFAGELAALQRIWKTDKIVDPFHHPHLSRSSEQFAVGL